MSEKKYRPIIKEGDHLLHSKEHPERVRGLTRDADNKNQHIIEWEEDDEQPERTLEDALAGAAGAAIAAVAYELGKRYLIPFARDKAWPWLKKTGAHFKRKFLGNSEQKAIVAAEESVSKSTEIDSVYADASTKVEANFEQFCIDMDTEEAKTHMMRILHHLLSLVREIQIMSCAQIKDESEEKRVEKQKEFERMFSAKVADCMNQLLSNDRL